MQQNVPTPLAVIFALILAGTLLFSQPQAIKAQTEATDHSAELLKYEAQAVYFTNLKRREHGLPPLRWNRELTLAARDFSYDSVENRPGAYCNHEDSRGRGPGGRIKAAGYVAESAWGENVVCGYVAPRNAVEAWYTSETGHREQLLNEKFREIGVGYYYDSQRGRGYITQDLSHDPAYAPVIIENEALAVESSRVNLYIYRPAPRTGSVGIKDAFEMMVANDVNFTGATWQPFTSEMVWELAPGEGWRTVYVKVRDRLGRSTVARDFVYVGSELPIDQLTLEHASAFEDTIVLDSLPSPEWPLIQMRLNWLADDADATFRLQSGVGGQVADPAANGGTTFHLQAQGGPSTLYLNSTQIPKGVPMQAFVRLKTADNQTNAAVAKLTISGGGEATGPRTIRGTDFATADAYQIFSIPFIYREKADSPLLTVLVSAIGGSDLHVDSITFFTDPKEVEAPLTWNLPRANYRGQSVWVRYTDRQGNISNVFEINPGAPQMPAITLTPGNLEYVIDTEQVQGSSNTITLFAECTLCTDSDWTASSDSSWLLVERNGDEINIVTQFQELGIGSYSGAVTVEVPGRSEIAPVRVRFRLNIAAPVAPGIEQQLQPRVFMPLALN